MTVSCSLQEILLIVTGANRPDTCRCYFSLKRKQDKRDGETDRQTDRQTETEEEEEEEVEEEKITVKHAPVFAELQMLMLQQKEKHLHLQISICGTSRQNFFFF